MSPEMARRASRALFVLSLALVAASPAHALRIVNYNILNYPGSTVSVRNPHFRTVLGPLGADAVVVQEMQSQAGVDSFRTNVLNVLEPGQWESAPFINGNDTDNALFYKTSRVQFLGQWSFYPNPATNLRLVNVFRLKPVGYSAAAAELRILSCHLKASTGFETDRLNEAIGIRDTMNAMPSGTHAILTGDFNIYTGSEPAFLKFKESQADNDGRLYDPLNAPAITWNTGSLSWLHTQSPCNGSGCASGAATGGLDDRFDMFLPTLNMGNGEGLDLLVSTYGEVGNDGLHYNLNITDSPTIPEGAAYATALISASDHLPIRVDLQLPARSGASALLVFGNVITGATAALNLAVTNASAPLDVLDDLDYSMAASPGFTYPGGSFSLAEGGAANHAIGMDTSTPGARSGTLTLASDDPDYPARLLPLSGTVLRHAEASLDSLIARDTLTVDFGYHEAGQFAEQEVRVHNRGWDALQAQLAVGAANLSGGDGRFSIAGGFSPVQLAGVGQTWPLAFAASGATADSAYEATLAFSSADEPLPGALPRPGLTVTLRARVDPGGTVDVTGAPPPTATRLYPPAPNPLVGASIVRLDLAHATEGRLEVFDALGRRVATLLEGRLEPGRYSVRWDGSRADGNAARPGLYFVRLSGRGMSEQTARLAVLH